MKNELIKQLQNIQILRKLQEVDSYIRDSSGRPLARLEDQGDQIILFDMSGRPLGRYFKSGDYTTDAAGNLLNYGNALGLLTPH